MQLLYSVFACITAQGSLAETLSAFSRSLIFLNTRVLPSSNQELMKLVSGIGCSCGHLPHAYLRKKPDDYIILNCKAKFSIRFIIVFYSFMVDRFNRKSLRN